MVGLSDDDSRLRRNQGRTFQSGEGTRAEYDGDGSYEYSNKRSMRFTKLVELESCKETEWKSKSTNTRRTCANPVSFLLFNIFSGVLHHCARTDQATGQKMFARSHVGSGKTQQKLEVVLVSFLKEIEQTQT